MRGDSGDTCHLPNCPHPRVTITLCAYHAARLLVRLPVETAPQPVRKAA